MCVCVRVTVCVCVCALSLGSSKGTCESAGSLGKVNLAVAHNSELITAEELWSVGRAALRRVRFHVRWAIARYHHRTYPLVYDFNQLLSRGAVNNINQIGVISRPEEQTKPLARAKV